MSAELLRVASFPSLSLASFSDGLPVEVSLIAQLGVGGGDALVRSASERQRGHVAFVDALDEPSVRIGAMDLDHGDASSLYTFSVGGAGHPFHRHAGNRVFTAVSGSGGTLLRFSTASDAQVARQASAFVRALRHVHIPPDCLFTVRFGGGTWHQFLPLRGEGRHPALFALSCHTNELGGELDEPLRRQVAANAADIPSLTQTLPPEVLALLAPLGLDAVPTFSLSLESAPASLPSRLCAAARGVVGPLRGKLAAARSSGGSWLPGRASAGWTRWRKPPPIRCCANTCPRRATTRTASSCAWTATNCPHCPPRPCWPRCSKASWPEGPPAWRG